MSLLSQLTSTHSGSKKRVGRGYGSGKGGHTSGKGQKGQNSRRGGGVDMLFEGGQLPITKRMPMLRGKGRLKVVRPTATVTLDEINKMKAAEISLDTLKLEKVIDPRFKTAKIILSGKIDRKVTVTGTGLKVSKGAKEAISKVDGVVEVA